MGDERPFAMRPLHTRAFTVPLMLPAHSTQDYYLEVSSTSSLNLPLQIASVQPFIGEHEREEWLHGAGFGVAAGMHTHPAEIGVKTGFHELPGSSGQRAATSFGG